MESGATTALDETIHVAKRTNNGGPALQTDVCVVIDVLIGIHLVSLTEECPVKKEGIDITFCCKGRFVRF
jgi:hypothetical protein